MNRLQLFEKAKERATNARYSVLENNSIPDNLTTLPAVLHHATSISL